MSRIITGLSAAGIWCLIIYINSFYLIWVTITLLAVVGIWEYIDITLENERVLYKALIVFLGAIPLLCSLSLDLNLIVTGLMTGFILNCILAVFSYSRVINPFHNLLHGSFAIIYIGFCASFLVMVMSFADGALLLLLLTAITAASDSGAYFTGINLGRKKLVPRLSPGKTTAGLLGGFLSGSAAAFIVGLLFLCHRSLPAIALTAVLLVGLATIGDFTESVIKRDQKIKNSGSLLPGHGGILDRFDSLLLNGPLFYYLVYWGVI
ncbi:MAG: phosphatidate cytidylyltransferase [Thermodesulfobacteriota bacterium]